MTTEQLPSSTDRTDEQTVLTADELTREFGSVAVVEDMSLRLDSGTLHALIGPNGSGKTTLLRLLAGIIQPTTGTVSVDGGDRLRTIGYLPQQPDFRPSFTVMETIEFYAALVDDDPAALLSRVGLRDAADRRVEDLSGGMTRLLGLAQAIAGDPPIVLLDEPGSGLDPRMRRRTIDVAQSLVASGTAVLYSTHDLELAEQSCDRLSVVEAGQLVETGPPAQLLDQQGAASLREAFESLVDESDDGVTVIGEGDR